RFQFFASLSRLAAHDFAGVVAGASEAEVGGARGAAGPEPANGAVAGPTINWAAESAYLAGLAHLEMEENAAAASYLARAASGRESPTAAHAQALLGSIGLAAHDHEEAARWLNMLDPKI